MTSAIRTFLRYFFRFSFSVVLYGSQKASVAPRNPLNTNRHKDAVKIIVFEN
jgi:hypothetical protein